MNATKSDVERFWSLVTKTPSCWLFGNNNTRPKFKYYDIVKQRFVAIPAARFAFATSKGPIVEGMFICHHCDNHLCVNPKHLFQGTAQDNSQDMLSKGRGPNQHKRWAKSQVLIDRFLSSRFKSNQ